MTWGQLLSSARQGRPTEKDVTIGRSVFQRDFDRIVYSSAFRRLQDKAQVFPLAKSDFVRTRLTHSLEVSCVGRSLGTELGFRLQSQKQLPDPISPADIGNIVAAACLAHDIGNPPFGHTGESAIAEWFSNTDSGQAAIRELTPAQKCDLTKFEGNAQGFRILTRLQNAHNPGLQLTSATLAAFTKYPRGSYLGCGSLEGVSWKKHGFFDADTKCFREIAEAVGLTKQLADEAVWVRHPLAYLVEAADDICYRVNDLEDGFRLKYVSVDQAKDLLLAIFESGDTPTKWKDIDTEEDQMGYLRAKAINYLIDQSVTYFENNSELILDGKLHKSLVDCIPSAQPLDRIIKISKERIYKAREVLEIEAAGFQVLGGLLEVFISATNDVSKKGLKKSSVKNQTIFNLLPPQFREVSGTEQDQYLRILKVTDFISGMTDSFAVSLYKQLTGISLPTG
ncbi:MAG: deoxyguanosinetriphosphate triphosphohydrolase [Nitrospira sp. LK265]|nr:deoxyguanosinetriphosphate triphosphohydrolase [Nitrospira sp. LK265]